MTAITRGSSIQTVSLVRESEPIAESVTARATHADVYSGAAPATPQKPMTPRRMAHDAEGLKALLASNPELLASVFANAPPRRPFEAPLITGVKELPNGMFWVGLGTINLLTKQQQGGGNSVFLAPDATVAELPRRASSADELRSMFIARDGLLATLVAGVYADASYPRSVPPVIAQITQDGEDFVVKFNAGLPAGTRSARVDAAGAFIAAIAPEPSAHATAASVGAALSKDGARLAELGRAVAPRMTSEPSLTHVYRQTDGSFVLVLKIGRDNYGLRSDSQLLGMMTLNDLQVLKAEKGAVDVWTAG